MSERSHQRNLPAHPATIYGEDVSVEVIARGRRQEDCGARQIVRLTPATCRNALEDLSITSLVGLQSSSVGSSHVAWSDSVDVNVVFGPLIGEGLGELSNATF